ncbi:MAG: hypothetical protein AB7H97_20630 [Pseudobdellovibrionaceae bacterium]
MDKISDQDEYEEIDPPIVNRVAVTVKFKTPYLEWANNLPDNGGMTVTLEDLNRSPNVYLIPSYETTSSIERFLQKVKPQIFEQQLNGWCTEPNWWPKNRSAREFNKWFDVEICEMVFDLVENDSLGHEEY